MTTKRKPYVRPMTSTGGKIAVLSLYMLREGTAVPAVWFSIELIFGLFALKMARKPWRDSSTLQNPVIVIINLITLAAALLHTKTGLSWHQKQPISL